MNARRLMILFVAGLGLNAHAQIACTGEKSKIPVFKNVVIVVEENQSFEDVIRKDSKMPYLNELAARGGWHTATMRTPILRSTTISF